MEERAADNIKICLGSELQVVLASGSPRRQQLLGEMGLNFIVKTSNAKELFDLSLGLGPLCEHNAQLKAMPEAESLPSSLIIAGDTLVCFGESLLGKPKDIEEAREMLRLLSGNEHMVCTGVSLMLGSNMQNFHQITKVKFKVMTDLEIDKYLNEVHVLDKAGSYAAQEKASLIIESIKGDLSNVIGLPQARLKEELQRFLLKS